VRHLEGFLLFTALQWTRFIIKELGIPIKFRTSSRDNKAPSPIFSGADDQTPAPSKRTINKQTHINVINGHDICRIFHQIKQAPLITQKVTGKGTAIPLQP
jgi:hypothetical protein